jgi:cardiolipin synthase
VAEQSAATAGRPGLATWANVLTLARLVSAPALAWAILEGRVFVALGLFVAACASDFADGGLARRLGQSSSLGGLLDHATDATLMVTGLGALALRGLVPPLLPVLVAAAFLQYVVDSRAAAGRPLRPNPIGRWNGIAYYVLLGTPLVRDAVGALWPWDTLVAFAGWVLVASTALSMVQRFRTRPR